MEAIPTKMEGYGIGQQDFCQLRENGFIYVDKTVFIDKLIKAKSQYCFLARPRRFGKSLFLSTLRYFFEGRRDLFKGLFIESTDWKWEKYPVLYLDLNTDRYADQHLLDGVLNNTFLKWEEQYGITEFPKEYSQRFRNIIAKAHETTGKSVVILVDEYDKPLVSNLNQDSNFDHYRAFLSSLYSNFKSSAEHIRMVFLTGVSRFSKLSVFSDLNNLNDLTFTESYADICGITEKELRKYFQEGINKLAKKEGLQYENALQLLKQSYDGYKFAANGSDIYNPWSVLNAMQESHIDYYWNDTGIPKIVAEALKRVDANLEEIFDTYCEPSELKGFDLLNPNPTALLYQTGYLTIKDYDKDLNIFHLGIPNKEVKKGLYRILLPYYVETNRISTNRTVIEIVRNFNGGNPDKAMLAMQTYFAGIDYRMKMDNENNFQNAFFLLTNLIGLDTESEVHTSDGSIDIKIETKNFIYIIELKYDHSADSALQQIEDKKYVRPWQMEHREVFLIGAAFSSKTRCIENWRIKKLTK